MVSSAFPQITRYTHPLSDSDGRVFARAKDDLLVNGELTDYDLFAESAQQKVPLGSRVMDLATGQIWRYCKNGAVALLPGAVLQAPVPAADHTGLAIQTAAVVGDATLKLTNGGTTAIAIGDYRGGVVLITAGAAGLGDMYRIRDTDAAATGATVTLTLYDKIRRALVIGTHTAMLAANPYKNLIAHVATPTARVVSAAQIPVTANYYFWGLTRGLGAGLTSGTVVIGDSVAALGATGAVAAVAAFTNDVVGNVVRVGATGAQSLIWYELE